LRWDEDGGAERVYKAASGQVRELTKKRRAKPSQVGTSNRITYIILKIYSEKEKVEIKLLIIFIKIFYFYHQKQLLEVK
jgi:hypothetical protein